MSWHLLPVISSSTVFTTWHQISLCACSHWKLLHGFLQYHCRLCDWCLPCQRVTAYTYGPPTFSQSSLNIIVVWILCNSMLLYCFLFVDSWSWLNWSNSMACSKGKSFPSVVSVRIALQFCRSTLYMMRRKVRVFPAATGNCCERFYRISL